MPSNYELIGKHIRLVDVRNKDLKVERLVGLSITKRFIASVANVVGTDMANYKIIKKGQFACSIMQVRRDGKMPVALMEEYEEAIISQAYPVFEVIDEAELLPEYLMMWMSRSEFDRHACFLAVGGVRGSLEWEDFLEMELPIPHIDVQRAMVKEYNTITDRIALNEQLNQKLEETAQTLYRQWFVDFEFPYDFEKGEPSLKGKPYKSNGGEMVWCAELDKDIPRGWEAKTIEEVVDLGRGSSPRPIVDYISTEGTPWIKIADATRSMNQFLLETKECITDEGVPKSRLLPPGTLILANSGSLGTYQILDIEACAHDGWHIFYQWNLVTRQFMTQALIFHNDDILTSAYGSVFTNLKLDYLKEYILNVPDKKTLNFFTQIVLEIEKWQLILAKENSKVEKLRSLLLSKMSTVEVGAGGGVGVG